MGIYRMRPLLANWVEGEATWQVSRVGVPWGGAGATGAGSDLASTFDAEVSALWAPGWIDFDVTNGIKAMVGGRTNFGWLLERGERQHQLQAVLLQRIRRRYDAATQAGHHLPELIRCRKGPNRPLSQVMARFGLRPPVDMPGRAGLAQKVTDTSPGAAGGP